MGKTIEDAGILNLGGKDLTEIARYRFIEDVKNQLKLGSNFNIPFLTPCGPYIPPAAPNDILPDLHDRKLFATWQDQALGAYLNITKTLNIEGQTPFLPVIFDPLHVAAKLNLPLPQIKLSEYPSLLFNLPSLMLKLEISAPDIASNLPKIMSIIDVPTLPIPQIPEIPDIKLMSDLPSLTVDPILQLPDMVASLIADFPNMLGELFSLNFSKICDLSLKIFMVPLGPNPSLQIATAKTLALKTTECVGIDVVGLTMGSSPGGATGAIGKELGYVPPQINYGGSSIRDKIIKYAKSMNNLSYGDKSTKEKYTLGLFPHLIFKNNGEKSIEKYADTENGKSGTAGKPKNKAFYHASGASSCGLFVRGALIAAGADGDSYFTDEYKSGTAISSLLRIARKREALIFDKNSGQKSIPAIKKGDFVIIGSESGNPYPLHVELFLDDYSGGYGKSIEGIGGGAPDLKNKINGDVIGSAIKTATYNFVKKTESGYYNYPFAGIVENGITVNLRPILAIIDSEKLINYNK